MKIFIMNVLLLIIIFITQKVNTENFIVPIPCSNDNNCRSVSYLPSNSICRNGFCVCYEGGVLKNCTAPNTMLFSTKTSGAIIGRRCKLPVDCNIEQGFCNTTMSQCLCKHGFVSNIDNNKCLPIVRIIGGSCEDNKQCLANLPHTTCSQNQCICSDGYHHANNICFKNIAIGETCKNTEECSNIDHAECNQNNVCVCSFDSVLNIDGKHCLPLAREFSHDCTQSQQCYGFLGNNSQCINNHCQCLSSAHFVTTIHNCIITKYIDDICDNDDNCYQDEPSDSETALKCENNICTCADNYMRDGNKCIVSSASATISKISLVLFIISLLIFSTAI